MKKFGLKSIRLKFVLTFISILLISCILSFVIVVNFYFDRTLKDIQEQLLEEANTIVQLADKTDLSPKEIVELSRSSFYSLTMYEKVEDVPVHIDDQRRQMLENHKSVFVLNRSEKHVPVSLFKIKEQYVMLVPVVNTYLAIMRNLVLTTLLFCAAMGSIMMLIAVQKITKPVKLLTDATRQVAKGNFDVHVNYSSRDEVGLLAHNFNLMAKELKHIEYLRKDFVSSVSHEFKTPISSIQGFARLLKTKALPAAKFDEYTDVIIEETERLTKLSSNMLRLSRLENQTILDKQLPFFLDEQIRKTILLLENDWQQKEIEFELDLPKTEFLGNEELIQQIWINLIHNAIKFSRHAGVIAIQLSHIGKTTVVQITDEGMGIPKPSQERIFEEFYQAEGSHASEGNGLGLAIVKKVIDLCGGTISVQSVEGEGTTFTVTLS
ncbi:MAG: HAMP domain-containing histidine kinase [Gorillibacterium sp.]|nr:HAMP domain-containing histidine kinase [Gorillibacterium sp.]